MGRGILGKTLSVEPLASGKPLVIRNADPVPGATCEVHALADPAEAARALYALVHRADGVDVCVDCFDRIEAWRRSLQP